MDKRSTVLINAYPDIKWTLEFSFNFTHAAAYTHGNLPEYSRNSPLSKEVREQVREMRNAQSKSVGSGKEMARVRNSPEMLTSFGLKLQAEWDDGKRNMELGSEFAEKIRKVLGIFIKYKELADKVKNAMGGAVKKTKGSLPFMLEIESPALSASVSWQLATENGKIYTLGTLNFKAAPLVGAKFTVDLLALGSRMHPFVSAFVAGLQGALAAANGGVIMEAKFKGQFGFDFKALEINTLKRGITGGSLDLGVKFGIKVLVKLNMSIKMKSYSAKPLIELNAAAEFSAFFTGGLTIDADDKGVFAKPSLGFSGMIFTFEIEIVVRGFKTSRKFGNETEPFLQAETSNLPTFYIT